MNREELLAAFKFFDKEGKGYLTTTEYSTLLVELGGVVRDSEELKGFISIADPKNEGNVYYEHLVNLFARAADEIPLRETEKTK